MCVFSGGDDEAGGEGLVILHTRVKWEATSRQLGGGGAGAAVLQIIRPQQHSISSPQSLSTGVSSAW